MSISRPRVVVVLLGLAVVTGIIIDCKAGECLRLSDCSGALVCVEGVCIDAGVDAGLHDDAETHDADADAHEDADAHDAEPKDGAGEAGDAAARDAVMDTAAEGSKSDAESDAKPDGETDARDADDSDAHREGGAEDAKHD